MRETSRGHIELASNSPWDAPLIDPNYLDTEQDVVDYRNAVRLTKEIVMQEVRQLRPRIALLFARF